MRADFSELAGEDRQELVLAAISIAQRILCLLSGGDVLIDFQNELLFDVTFFDPRSKDIEDASLSLNDLASGGQ